MDETVKLFTGHVFGVKFVHKIVHDEGSMRLENAYNSAFTVAVGQMGWSGCR